MSGRIAVSVLVPVVAVAVGGVLFSGQALAAGSSSITQTTCVQGGGKVVRAPIGPITQPFYKCQGGKYNGRGVSIPSDTHKHP